MRLRTRLIVTFGGLIFFGALSAIAVVTPILREDLTDLAQELNKLQVDDGQQRLANKREEMASILEHSIEILDEQADELVENDDFQVFAVKGMTEAFSKPLSHFQQQSHVDFAIILDREGAILATYPAQASKSALRDYFSSDAVNPTFKELKLDLPAVSVPGKYGLILYDKAFAEIMGLDVLDWQQNTKLGNVTVDPILSDFGDNLGTLFTGDFFYDGAPTITAHLPFHIDPEHGLHSTLGAAIYYNEGIANFWSGVDDIPPPLDPAQMQQIGASHDGVKIPLRIADTDYLFNCAKEAIQLPGIIGCSGEKLDLVEAVANKMTAMTSAQMDKFIFAFSAVTTAVGALFLLLTIPFAGMISRPMEELSRALWRLAKGDLATKVPDMSNVRVTEISRFAESVDKFRSALNDRDVLQEQMAKSLDDLRQSNINLQEARSRAEVAAQSKAQFLANMSHEIRTPMNGAIGTLEMLELSELTDDQRRMTRAIHQSSIALLRIIDDILDVSKIEAGKLTLRDAPTDVSRLIEDILLSMYPVAQTANVSISGFVHPDVPEWISLDPIRLRQIMTNLIGNAIKFSKRDANESPGRVDVTAEIAADGTLRLVFADNGVGMSTEFQSHMFEPFTQSEEHSRRRFGGTGLGLTIVRQIVAMMQGTISVESELGKGSTFTISLPVNPLTQASARPNLDGTVFVGLFESLMARYRISELLQGCGASFVQAEDFDDLVAQMKAAGDGAVAVLDRESQIGTLGKKLPGARCILLAPHGTRKLGVASASLYVVGTFPLLTSELRDAAAVMTGKASPKLETEPLIVDQAKTTVESGRRILVVEDNEINQDVLKMQLGRIGHDVTLCANGAEGLKAWREGHFDLVLTDCHMPVMDGFEMTGRIRAEEQTLGHSAVPIVAITANAMTGEAARCLDAGMSDYLSKPVKLSELSVTLAKWLGSAQLAKTT